MKLSFTKMQGCANDYIYLDCRKSGVPENIAALSEKLSRRHFSIGADGIICICAAQTAGADGMMRIFNADGSEGRMCGNGIRCVASLMQAGLVTIHESCTASRREFGLYSWDDKAKEDRVVKENDHAMDDIRYFCYTILAPLIRWEDWRRK